MLFVVLIQVKGRNRHSSEIYFLCYYFIYAFRSPKGSAYKGSYKFVVERARNINSASLQTSSCKRCAPFVLRTTCNFQCFQLNVCFQVSTLQRFSFYEVRVGVSMISGESKKRIKKFGTSDCFRHPALAHAQSILSCTDQTCGILQEEMLLLSVTSCRCWSLEHIRYT